MIEGSAAKPAIVVSACLLGVECNHLGRHNLAPDVVALRDAYQLVAVCPETIGGLPTPRVAAARADDRVVNADGDDVTDAFKRGAAATVAIARAVDASRAVLKARSPSCDCRDGVTAQALREAGVIVESEEEVASPTMVSRDSGA
ncbi:MAG TPA: DUF523 domain-containing protein [Acidimicrobiales bacterium]|nr:DUF523 domain-containing protein [Acidimicrobiales bacterium]